jgi:hypothetical protein
MIADDVFTPYTKNQYGKTFEKFGSRMPDVEKARQAAAFLAADSGKCTRVESSEVSGQSTRANIQTFTDCVNSKTKMNERFRFSEADLKDKNGKFFTETTVGKGQQALTVQERALSKDSALSLCKETTKRSAKFPSSVKFFGHVANTSQGSGETWVEIDFEAKNDLGGQLPYKAYCNYPINGQPSFKVTNR